MATHFFEIISYFQLDFFHRLVHFFCGRHPVCQYLIYNLLILISITIHGGTGTATLTRSPLHLFKSLNFVNDKVKRLLLKSVNGIQIIIMLLILKVATRVLQLLLCLSQLIHRLIVICAQIIKQFLKLDAFLLKLIYYLIDCLFCLRIYRSLLFEQIRNYLNIINLRVNCF